MKLRAAPSDRSPPPLVFNNSLPRLKFWKACAKSLTSSQNFPMEKRKFASSKGWIALVAISPALFSHPLSAFVILRVPASAAQAFGILGSISTIA